MLMGNGELGYRDGSVFITACWKCGPTVCRPGALLSQGTVWIVCLLLLYVLTTSKVISGRVPTCDRAHSWLLYSAAQLGNQAASTMTWFSTHSHYPDPEPTSPCPILIMPSTYLGSHKYQFYKSLVWLDCGLNPRSPTRKTSALLTRPPGLVETV